MKTITLKPFALCFAILGLGGTVSAQNDLNLPDVSQAAEVKQRVALKHFEYVALLGIEQRCVHLGDRYGRTAADASMGKKDSAEDSGPNRTGKILTGRRNLLIIR